MARQALHDILCGVLQAPFPDGEDHCYFQPPGEPGMKYPCIAYNYTNDDDDFADNIHYRSSKRYTVTVIDEDPDSKIPARLKELPYCTPDRNFAVNGLNHFVYTLYYSGPRIKEEDNNEQDQMGSDWGEEV